MNDFCVSDLQLQYEDGHTVQVATFLPANVANIAHKLPIKVANMVHN